MVSQNNQNAVAALFTREKCSSIEKLTLPVVQQYASGTGADLIKTADCNINIG